ncbi:MAG: methionine--tRNA ligase [Candidatus Pacebacteria bacterium]|nr:methionine--tRNA ligase [Candidatus Paceibacterota bacterium]
MEKNFYITTTLPYVNARPHLGHALEFVRADVIARYKKMLGFNVFFNTGTDEHGEKIWNAATKENVKVENYVKTNAQKFKHLLRDLNILEDIHFIRTTDPKHIRGAQKLWEIVSQNGFIYKANYKAKYCVGCELEKTDSELRDNKCPQHPNLDIVEINEENYFFRFSAFQKKLLDFYSSRPDFVLPESRMKEIVSFVSKGLRDFSISRLRKKMPWGAPVPKDEEHVMYVWFDALANYITTLGWPDDISQFNKFWVNGTPTQYCGQDNLRQQAAMWQAMLMAAGLPLSYQIVVNGFVTGAGGVKMSKTLGNTIDPKKLIAYYGTDALRYYVVRHIHPWDGSAVSDESFHEAYSANLVNGLGNLVSRILTMAERYLLGPVDISEESLPEEWRKNLDSFRIDSACDFIWKRISDLDKAINEEEAFKIAKKDIEKARKLVSKYVKELSIIAKMLEPILPQTSLEIQKYISLNKKPLPMFVRKEMIR